MWNTRVKNPMLPKYEYNKRIYNHWYLGTTHSSMRWRELFIVNSKQLSSERPWEAQRLWEAHLAPPHVHEWPFGWGSVPPPSTWGTGVESMNLECSVLSTNILSLSFLPGPQRSEPWCLRTQGWMLIPRCSKMRMLGARDKCTSSRFSRGGRWGLWAGIQATNDFL